MKGRDVMYIEQKIEALKKELQTLKQELQKEKAPEFIVRTIIYQPETNLEWMVGPDESTNWNQTNEWIKSLGPGWRFPTIEELKTLYRISRETWNLPSEFNATGWWWVWSEKKDSLSAWSFYFNRGNESWNPLGRSHDLRGFVVRSRS